MKDNPIKKKDGLLPSPKACSLPLLCWDTVKFSALVKWDVTNMAVAGDGYVGKK
jgi:hypothetical protein